MLFVLANVADVIEHNIYFIKVNNVGFERNNVCNLRKRYYDVESKSFRGWIFRECSSYRDSVKFY